MARKKGIPAIRQRKDAKGNPIDVWEALINLGTDPGTGKTKRIPVYGKSHEECRQKLIAALASIDTQTFIEPNKITLEGWLDTWLQEYKKNSLSDTTYSSYEWMVKKYVKPALGKALLKDLRPEQIQKFYNTMFKTLSAKTVRNVHVVLHEALKQAVKNDLLAKNVTEMAVLPKLQKKEIQVLPLEQQKKLMAVLESDRIGVSFILAMNTGCRMGEILGLSWENVDFDNGIITIKKSLSRVYSCNAVEKKYELKLKEPKTKTSKREIPLLDDVVTRLKEYKKQESDRLKTWEWDDITIQKHFKTGLVFTSEVNGMIEPRNFIRRFHNLLEKADVERTNFHSLRHLFATRGLESGIDLKTMQELLGHANIGITADIYSHVSLDLKRTAINKLAGLYAAEK